MDGGSVFASVVLLLLMLGFSFNRILGLDRFVKQAAVWVRVRRDIPCIVNSVMRQEVTAVWVAIMWWDDSSMGVDRLKGRREQAVVLVVVVGR